MPKSSSPFPCVAFGGGGTTLSKCALLVAKSFFGLGLVAQASLLADNKSVKGVRCKLTIVAASPQLQGDSEQMQMLITYGFTCEKIIFDFDINKSPSITTGNHFQAYQTKELVASVRSGSAR